ncbi:MAG TPA: nucleoside deaminase, partial [Planctomycetota bacterium]|nr:nucleoside deaminase [Planctomycetota bacterium]
MTRDEKFMRLALAEARQALREGEVPIGAVAVRRGEVIARGHNRRNALRDLTAHAEMMCLRDLSRREGLAKRLTDVTIYSTLEPCAMCSGAMIHHRVGRCVWGERDTLLGAAGSSLDFLRRGGVRQRAGVLRAECRGLLLEFFERQLGRPTTA